MSRYRIGSVVRCIDGDLYRHDPQYDDPYLETVIGRCPDCDGRGCDADETEGQQAAVSTAEQVGTQSPLGDGVNP